MKTYEEMIQEAAENVYTGENKDDYDKGFDHGMIRMIAFAFDKTHTEVRRDIFAAINQQ